MGGSLEVWKAYDEDGKNLLAVHGVGHFFGEMALIDELPRSATLVAREESRVLFIKRVDFQSLIRSNSSIAISVLMSTSLMVRNSNETFMEDLRKRNVRLEAANAELKAAQAELLRNERLSTIGKFSSLILHDIRNPLSVMKALTDIIAMNVQDPVAVASGLSRMRAEIAMLERLASEFLDYSRGEIRLSLGITSAGALFSKLSDNLEEKLKRSNVEMKVANAIDGPIVLDEDRFLRLLLNLSDNARKAMPKGGILAVAARREGERLVFTVSDNGEGMNPETLSHIFEPFFSNSGKGGTGLGMLIVKNIVEAHDGTITVSSREGAGTEVVISIPARL
jgi:signal transduction histidine kinase